MPTSKRETLYSIFRSQKAERQKAASKKKKFGKIVREEKFRVFRSTIVECLLISLDFLGRCLFGFCSHIAISPHYELWMALMIVMAIMKRNKVSSSQVTSTITGRFYDYFWIFQQFKLDRRNQIEIKIKLYSDVRLYPQDASFYFIFLFSVGLLQIYWILPMARVNTTSQCSNGTKCLNFHHCYNFHLKCVSLFYVLEIFISGKSDFLHVNYLTLLVEHR